MDMRCTVAGFTVGLILLPAYTFAQTQHSAKPKAVAPASAQTQDFTLKLTANYCDTVAPYQYVDRGDGKPSLEMLQRTPNLTGGVYDTIKFPHPPTAKSPLTIVDPGSSILGDADRELGPDGYDAARLIVRTVLSSLAATTGCISTLNKSADTKINSFSDAVYYLIDVVRWETVETNGQTMNQIASDHWYLFNYSDAKAANRHFPFSFHPVVATDLRIFGESKVIFLAIHLAPSGASPSKKIKATPTSSPDQPEWFDTTDISYKLHATKMEPLNVQDLESLVNLITGITVPAPQLERGEVATTPQPFQGRYGAALLTNLTTLPTQVTSTMTADFTAPNEASKSSAYSAPTDVDKSKPSLAAYKNSSTKPVTAPGCDVSTLKNQIQTPCTVTQTIQDEGLYHWDISIAVPTPGYKDISVSGANNSVQTSVRRTDAFGMLDIAPWGEDFRKPPVFGIPHIMMGLPLSGKVLDRPFVGGIGEEVGLSKLLPFSARVFCGVVYAKESQAIAGSSTLAPYRVWKVQYGIEFSISSVISQLKGSGSSNSKSSTAKNSPTNDADAN